MPLKTTAETELVEIFLVRTIGVAMEVSDLWQDSAFCKEANFFLVLQHLSN